MVTLNAVGYMVATYMGLSTDTKPTDAENGAEFQEIDTGDVYHFDAGSSRWFKSEIGTWQ